jgi:transposase
VTALLADLHGLLAADVALAAPVLARLTGSIVVTQGGECGRKSTPWVARFSPDVGAALAELPLGRGGPAQEVWQYADQYRDKTGKEVEVLIGEVPQYEALAPRFKELHDRGASIRSIAAAHGMTLHYVSQIIRFAETGERPKRSERPGTGKRRPPGRSYKEIAALVAELRDLENLTSGQIVRELKSRDIDVSESTVLRAYDHAHHEAIRKAVEAGEAPDRSRFRLLEQRRQAQIEELLREGVKSVAQVAKEFGCSRGKVYRIRKELSGTAGDEVNGLTGS